jgi:hypothetical protein
LEDRNTERGDPVHPSEQSPRIYEQSPLLYRYRVAVALTSSGRILTLGVKPARQPPTKQASGPAKIDPLMAAFNVHR